MINKMIKYLIHLFLYTFRRFNTILFEYGSNLIELIYLCTNSGLFIKTHKLYKLMLLIIKCTINLPELNIKKIFYAGQCDLHLKIFSTSDSTYNY